MSKPKWLPKLAKTNSASSLLSENNKTIEHVQRPKPVKSSSGLSVFEEVNANRHVDSESDSIGTQHSTHRNTGGGHSPAKIFSKKLKHERMGYMDSKVVRKLSFRFF